VFILLELIAPKTYKNLGEYETIEDIYDITNTEEWDWERYLGNHGTLFVNGLACLKFKNLSKFDLSTIKIV
jgi:hypothetical protein